MTGCRRSRRNNEKAEEHAKELADEMPNELLDDEWAEFYDGDVQEAFFGAALDYAEDTDDFVS